MGRFINADSYTSTGQGIIGNNMFAYCLNNPVNYLDSKGTDAIWIQERNSANGMGHTGLLVQDSQGNWWYFYWGPKDPNAFFVFMCISVPEVCIYENVDTDGYDLSTPDGIQEMLNANDIAPYPGSEPGEITGTKYYKGDYSNTHRYLTCYSSTLAKDFAIDYSLLTNNCVQVCVRALRESDWRFTFYPSLVPNLAYRDVKDSGEYAYQVK